MRRVSACVRVWAPIGLCGCVRIAETKEYGWLSYMLDFMVQVEPQITFDWISFGLYFTASITACLS